MNLEMLNNMVINESTRALLCSKEKIDRVKKRVVRIVESLLESEVSSEVLMKACETLSQADYSDVVEERNILNMCGYPLCSKSIKVRRAKYSISLKLGKIYDITERKCFCSNECYKASKFLKLQLGEEPVWLQVKAVKVELLTSNLNEGCAGEELFFAKQPFGEKIEKNVSPPKSSKQMKRNLLEEISQCALEFEHFTITDRDQQSSLSPTQHRNTEITTCKVISEKTNTSDEQSNSDTEELDSDDSKERFTAESSVPEKRSLSSCKSMPVIKRTKIVPPILIDALPMKVVPPSTSRSGISLETMQKTLGEWVTNQSKVLLLAKDHAEPISPPDEAIIEESEEQKLLKFCDGMQELCGKVDAMEIMEDALDKKVLAECLEDEGKSAEVQEANDMPQVRAMMGRKSPSCPKVQRQHNGPKKVKPKNRSRKTTKTVTFSADTKDPNRNSENSRESLLPLIDSLSQNTLRQQVVSERLKKAYENLLPYAGLYYRNISNDLRTLLSTFKFSPSNIVFTPSSWMSLGVVLLRMLNKISSHCEDSAFDQMLEKASLTDLKTIEDIDLLISKVIHFDANC